MHPIGIGIIKPLSITRGLTNQILSDIIAKGFVFEALVEKTLCPTTVKALLASETYSHSSILTGYEDSFQRGPSVLIAVTHRSPSKNHLSHWIEVVGVPASSIYAAPDSLRGRYGGHVWRRADAPDWDDAIHCSRSLNAVTYEHSLLFG